MISHAQWHERFLAAWDELDRDNPVRCFETAGDLVVLGVSRATVEQVLAWELGDGVIS